MRKFVNFVTRASRLKLLENSVMSKNNEKVYYAVGRGRNVGIYDTWSECKNQTEGVSNAKYRKFFSLEEAEEFVNFWKNYSSPVKESDESTTSVSKNRGRNSYYKEENYQMSKKLPNKTPKSDFSQKKNSFALGIENKETEYCSKPTVSVTPYISPMPPIIPSQFVHLGRRSDKNQTLKQRISTMPENISKGNGSRTVKRDSKAFEGSVKEFNEGRNSKVQNKKSNPDSLKQCHESSTSELNYPVTAISSVKCSSVLNNSTSYVTSTQKSLSGNSYSSDNRLSADLSVSVGSVVVKKEIIDIDTDNQNNKSQNSAQSVQEGLDLSDKLAKSFKMFESSLTLIMNHGGGQAETLKNCLKTLIEKIYTNTNTNVNLQIDSSENIDKICESSKNCDKHQSVGAQPSSAQNINVSASSNHQQQPIQAQCTSQIPQSYLQSVSPHSTSFEEKAVHRNVDVLALNLRLDSFEKRFDACLKEVGAIASEVSHIKAEIKEMKETTNSKTQNNQTAGSSYSPRKAKDRMLQTTLSFNSNVSNKSYSTYENGSRFESSGVKRSRKLKRKLSRNDSHESSKRFADDEKDTDDILRKIKTEAVDYASFVVDEDDYVEVYTDGASHCNGKDNAKAGIGIWWKEGHPLNVAEPVVGPPTNNTAEIQAARVAIDLAIKAGLKKLKIFTDSEFLINCATRWIHRWKKNGWVLVNGGPVKNKEELEKLDKVASKISVRWEKVAGHVGIVGNEMADRLANEGAAKYKR